MNTAIESFLRDQGVHYETHQHPTAYTAQGLAHVEHVTGYKVAKPVIVKGRSGYAMCVLPAPKRIQLRRVADALHDPEVRLATEEEMAGLFPDCELGAEPPVGAMFGLRTLMDPTLKDDESLLMQAGSHRESIKMSRADWERVCSPLIAPIAAG